MAQKQRKAASRGGQPEFAKALLWLVVAAAAVGMALAGYSTQLSLEIATQGISQPSGCTLGDFVNCDYAHASSYADFLGIPVAWWGFLFFAFTGLAALYGGLASNRRSAGGMLAMAWILSLVSTLMVVVKAYHLVDLGVVCLVCVGMYVCILTIAAVVPLALKAGGYGTLLTGWVAAARGGDHGLAFDPSVTRWAVVAAVIFGLGFVTVKREVDRNAFGGGIDVAQAVEAHFRTRPLEVDVDPAAAVWGNPDAAVQVVEFADFQCPACQQSAFHLRSALFEYRDRIQLRFMNFPLDNTVNLDMPAQNHANAGPAAKAAICAAEFGDFWGYHDDLFRNQSVLSPALYERFAEDRGWDTSAFTACTQREDVLARLRSDVAAGQKAQLRYTPSIYINGRYVQYWQNDDVIRAILDRELSEAG